MAKGSRSRGLRTLAILAGLFVLVVGGGALALRLILTPERLRAEVIRLTSEATGLNTSLDAATLSFQPFGVSLSALQIDGASPQDPPLFRLESGLVELDLAPLIGKRVVIQRIELDAPVVELRQENGVIVLPGKLGVPREKPSASPADGAPSSGAGGSAFAAGFRGTIEKLEIRNGTIRIATEGGTQDVELAGVGFTARVDASDGVERLRTTGELRLEGLTLAALEQYRATLDRLHPTVAFSLEYEATAGTLTINEVRLVAGPLDLSISGRLSGLPDEPMLELELAPRTLTLQELLPLVPPTAFPEGRVPTATGNVTVSARVEGALGDPGSPPSMELKLEFDDTSLGMQGFDLALERLSGVVVATGQSLEIKGLTAALGDGSLHLSGRVDDVDRPDAARYDLTVAGDLDLAVVEQTGMLPPGTRLSGRVTLDTRIRGSVATPEAAQLAGEVKLTDGGYEAPELAVPITHLSGTARLEGSDVALTDLTASLGRSRFSGSGHVTNALSQDPFLRFEGKSTRLDLTEWMPPTDASATGGAGAAAGGPATALDPSLPLVPPIPPFRADLTLQVDSLLSVGATLWNVKLSATLRDGRAHVTTSAAGGTFGEGIETTRLEAEVDVEGQTIIGDFHAPRILAHRVPLTDVRGTIRLGEDRQLAIHDVSASVWTGRVEGRADVDLTDITDPAFEIETRAVGLQANDFVSALTPAHDLLFGQLDITSSFRGRGSLPADIAQSLVGSGDVIVKNGRMNRGPQTQAIWKTLNLSEQGSIPFDDLVSTFSVVDGKLLTKDLVLGGGDTKWTANGFVGFDGIMDYSIEVELNDQLSDLFRKRVGGGIASLLQDSTGRVVLNLRIHGNASRPEVGLDRERLADRAQQNAADALREELEKQKDKLGGALKSLFGG